MPLNERIGLTFEDAVGGERGDEAMPLNERIGLTFEDAVGYLSLPREVAVHDGLKIEASIGRYGPYLKYNSSFVSLPPEHDVLHVGTEAAVQIVVDGIINKKGKVAKGVLQDFGDVEGGKLTVRDGRFGVYLNWKKVNAKMPADYVEEPTSIPKEVAWEAIQAKAAGKAGGKGKAAQDEGADAIALPPPPKRPMSAYLYFCADNRPAVSKTSTKLGDVSKELARLWKEAEGGREKWEAMAAEAKKKHELEKAVWDKECEKLRERAAMGGVVNPGVMPSGKETKKKAANKKKKKNEKQEKPPRAPSAYMIFCSEKRKSVMEMTNDDGEKLSFGEVTKTLAAQWKALGEDEKKIYTEKQKLQAAEVQAKEN